MDVYSPLRKSGGRDDLTLRTWREMNQILALRDHPSSFRLLQSLKGLLVKRKLQVKDIFSIYDSGLTIDDEAVSIEKCAFLLSSLLPFAPLPSGFFLFALPTSSSPHFLVFE